MKTKSKYMRPKILLKFLLFILLVACENENNNQNRNDEITVGDYSKMMVNSYDTILSDLDIKDMYLDIDRNDINDISLRSGYLGGMPSGGSSFFSEIRSLHNNALILGYYVTDTLFLNRDTILHYDSNSQLTSISEYYNHTCHRIDDADSILKITYDSFKILPKDKGSIMRNSEVFRADTLTLVESKTGYTSIGGNNDTSIYYIKVLFNDCYSFPQNEIKYIGLKLVNDNVEKLGWIKLCIMDIYKIFLLESAIQK